MSSIVAYSGIVRLNRKKLEKSQKEHQRVNIKMTGILIVARDVSPCLAEETIGIVNVQGLVRASRGVQAVLRSKRMV